MNDQLHCMLQALQPKPSTKLFLCVESLSWSHDSTAPQTQSRIDAVGSFPMLLHLILFRGDGSKQKNS